LFFSVKTRWINVVGVFVGLGGAVGLLSVSGGHSLHFNISFGVYVLLATLMYAVNINLIKKHLSEISTLAITSLAFVFIGLPALILLIFTSSFTEHLSATPEIWTGIGYVALLAVVGSGIAVLLYNRLIQRRSVLFAASVTYMMPIVAVLWGIADGEMFRPSFLIWIGIILCGVFLVNRRKKAI
jgi:drug/metabolite transporter (DMT)-like permease